MLDRADEESTCLFLGYIVNCIQPSDVSLLPDYTDALDSGGNVPGWLSSDLIEAGFWHNLSANGPGDVTYIGISDALRRYRASKRSDGQAMRRRFRNRPIIAGAVAIAHRLIVTDMAAEIERIETLFSEVRGCVGLEKDGMSIGKSSTASIVVGRGCP
jgi:translation elongation factor EF-1beta